MNLTRQTALIGKDARPPKLKGRLWRIKWVWCVCHVPRAGKLTSQRQGCWFHSQAQGLFYVAFACGLPVCATIISLVTIHDPLSFSLRPTGFAALPAVLSLNKTCCLWVTCWGTRWGHPSNASDPDRSSDLRLSISSHHIRVFVTTLELFAGIRVSPKPHMYLCSYASRLHKAIHCICKAPNGTFSKFSCFCHTLKPLGGAHDIGIVTADKSEH